jgi:hypothetical protein
MMEIKGQKPLPFPCVKVIKLLDISPLLHYLAYDLTATDSELAGCSNGQGTRSLRFEVVCHHTRTGLVVFLLSAKAEIRLLRENVRKEDASDVRRFREVVQ